jgi:hypothetical protein
MRLSGSDVFSFYEAYNGVSCDHLRSRISVSPYDLLNLLWMARRYANGRMTYAPDLFNEIYGRVSNDNELNEKDDSSIVKSFPLASDKITE